jgi:hypothetical protein
VTSSSPSHQFLFRVKPWSSTCKPTAQRIEESSGEEEAISWHRFWHAGKPGIFSQFRIRLVFSTAFLSSVIFLLLSFFPRTIVARLNIDDWRPKWSYGFYVSLYKVILYHEVESSEKLQTYKSTPRLRIFFSDTMFLSHYYLLKF